MTKTVEKPWRGNWRKQNLMTKAVDQTIWWRKLKKQNQRTDTVEYFFVRELKERMRLKLWTKVFGEGHWRNKPSWLKLWTEVLVRDLKKQEPDVKNCGQTLWWRQLNKQNRMTKIMDNFLWEIQRKQELMTKAVDYKFWWRKWRKQTIGLELWTVFGEGVEGK